MRSPAPPAGRPLRRRPVAPHTWPIRSLSRPVLGYVLGVDVLALAAVVLGVLGEPVTARDLPRAAMLLLGLVVHQELSAALARRAWPTGTPERVPVRLTALWGFAAVAAPPLTLAYLVIAVDVLHRGLRNPWRTPVHRWVFSAAGVVLASAAASTLLDTVPIGELATGPVGPLTVGVLAPATLLRWAVDFALVATLVAVTSPGEGWRHRLGRPGEATLGLGALGLGVAAAALVTTRPWLVLLVLVPLAAMENALLLGPLLHAAQTDDKTQLATAGHWRRCAARALLRTRADTVTAVLMVDLDHFKAINDARGHLVGDVALRAVARVLAQEVRPQDLVGRFGGEEFAVLLCVPDPRDAVVAAERLRRGVRALAVEVPPGRRDGTGDASPVTGLSVSVGVAVHPGHGTDVDTLLHAADSALYRAKRDGRDRVRVARPCDDPGPDPDLYR